MLEGLAGIKQTLSERARGIDLINRRGSNIMSLVDKFHSLDAAPHLPNDEDPDITRKKILTKAYEPLRYWYSMDANEKVVGEKDLTAFEDTATAYLIYKLEVTERTRKPEFTVRPDQIQSIVSLLRKDHLQSPTGSGKSSVILPIASLVKSLSENGSVSVVSASDELTTGLRETLSKFNELLPEEFQVGIRKQEQTSSEGSISEKDKDVLVKELVKEVVTGVTSEEIKRLHFKSLLGAPSAPSVAPVDKTKRGIVVFKDDDYVFWKIKNPKERVQHTYWDEIHVPYDRGSPYLLQGESVPTTLSVENYLYDRIVAGMMAERMDYWTNYFETFKEFEKGYDYNARGADGKIQDEKYEKLQKDFLAIMKANWNNYNYTHDYNAYVSPSVAKLAQSFEIGEDALKTWFTQKWTDQAESDKIDMFSEHVLALCKAKSIQEGSEFGVLGEKVISRDAYMGISLPDREYNPKTLLALQALYGKADYFSFIKTASDMTTFEGFIANHLNGAVSGLSGTLLTPTLLDPTLHESPLARFLKKYTDHSVFFTEKKQNKFIPHPDYFEDDVEADEFIFNLLRGEKRSTAIFTFNENEGKRLAEKLSAIFPDVEILFVSDSMSDGEAQSLYNAFADAEKKTVLISTGRTGVGVDIKKTTGDENHPDFTTIIKGVPHSRAQLFQAAGRRRLSPSDPTHPGKDIAWLFTKSDLSKNNGFRAHMQMEKDKIYRSFHELASDSALADQNHIRLAGHSRRTKTDLLDKILHRAESQLEEDDIVKTRFDNFYSNALRTVVVGRELVGFGKLMDDEKKKKQSVFRTEILEEITEQKQILFRHILESVMVRKDTDDPIELMFYAFADKPGNLYYDLQSFLNYAKGETSRARMADFYKYATQYLQQDELASSWSRSRGKEFAEIVKNATDYFETQLQMPGIPQDIIQKLNSGKAHIISLTQAQLDSVTFQDDGYQPQLQPDGRTALFYVQRDALTENRIQYQYMTPVLDTSKLIGGIVDKPFTFVRGKQTPYMVVAETPRKFAVLVNS